MAIKNFTASGAIPAYSVVKATATAGIVAQATAAADLVIGVIGDVAKADGERVDVYVGEEAYATAGAAIAFGKRLISNAAGRVIEAAAAAGTNVNTVGVAMQDATAAGDLIRIYSVPGTFQG